MVVPEVGAPTDGQFEEADFMVEVLKVETVASLVGP